MLKWDAPSASGNVASMMAKTWVKHSIPLWYLPSPHQAKPSQAKVVQVGGDIRVWLVTIDLLVNGQGLGEVADGLPVLTQIAPD